MRTLFHSAVIDGRIDVSPCAGVRLPDVPDAKYYIAQPGEVHALARALPERYRTIVYLAAGRGWRGGEIFGLERTRSASTPGRSTSGSSSP